MSFDETRRRFRELYRLHRRRGEVRPVEKYQRIFHGHSALIAREYDAIRQEDHESVHDNSPDADLTAARQIRDKVEITLSRLGQSSGERYRLRKELGRGAMGAVYDVRDGTLGRHVAMKVINDNFTSVQRSARGAAEGMTPAPLLVRRFVQEARITAFLDHPGVPPVHEMGLDGDGHLFFTMKVVDGLSFQEVLQQRKEAPDEWPLARLLQIFVRVCDTLSFAHTKGVVHRDLKPANIMVGSFGEVYVMDWGLAKVLADADVSNPNDSHPSFLDDSYGPSNALSATMVGSALGSPPYMPPEQAFGAIQDIGPHSDIYALGAMLYQVLTGHAPYTHPGGPGSPMAIIAAVKRGAPPPVRELAPDAPPEVAAIAEKAMARLVSDRYGSMDALSVDLQAFLDGRVVSVYGRGRVFALRKWIARNPVTSLAFGLALVTAIAGVAVVALQQDAAVKEIARERDKAQELAARSREESTRADGLRLCALSLAMSESNATDALLVAAEGAALAPGPDANKALYAALARQRERLFLDGHAQYVKDARFAPDGARIATLGRGGSVIVWNAADGRQLHRLDASLGPVRDIAFTSKNGLLLTRHESGTLRLWDPKSGEAVTAIETSGWTIQDLHVRPGAAEILMRTKENGLEIRDAETLARLRQVRVGDNVTASGYTPGGRYLFTLHGKEALRLWDPATDRLVRQVRTPKSATGKRLHVRLDRTGDYALFSGAAHALVHTPSGRVLRTFDEDARVLLGDAGTRLVTASASTDVGFEATNVEVLDLPSFEVRTTYRHPTGCTRMRIDADANLLLLTPQNGSASLHLVDLDRGAHIGSLDGHNYTVNSIRFSPDETEVITASRDMTARVWRLRDPAEHVVAATDPRLVDVMEISPDRRYAVVRPPRPEGAPHPSLEILERRSGQLLNRIPQTLGPVDAVRFDPRQRYVLARHRHDDTTTFAAYSLVDGTQIGTVPESAQHFHISENGDALITYDMEVESATFTLPACRPVARVRVPDLRLGRTVSGDGRVLAIADARTRRIEVWDAVKGERMTECLGHTGHISQIVLNADGTRLLTNAVDGSVRLWDTATGDRVATLNKITMLRVKIGFSPDDRYVSVCSPSRLRILHATDLTPFAEIDPVLGRFRSAWFAPDMSAFYSSGGGYVDRWPFDPLAEVPRRVSREIDAAILHEFEIGTEDERDARHEELARRSTSSTAVATWGHRCLTVERFDDAVAAYERGIELNPDCFRSWIGLARAHCRLARSRPDTPAGQTARTKDRENALRAFAEVMNRAPSLRAYFESDEAADEITGLPEYEALVR